MKLALALRVHRTGLIKDHLLSRCGHCKHLTPEYKKLGEAVASSPKLKDRVVIAKVTQPCVWCPFLLA